MDAQNKYELGVVIRADLEEEAFRAELDRVKGLIERFNGTIEKVDEWGRRKLAYPIAKQTEGMYIFITFSSEGGTPREVESRIRIMENVLRFLLVRKDEIETPPSKSQTVEPKAAEAEKPAEEAVPVAAEPQEAEPAVSEETPAE